LNFPIAGYVVVMACGLCGACSPPLPVTSADAVRTGTAETVSGCHSVGSTHVSVQDRLADYAGQPGRTASELLLLAKQGAAQLGGNVVIEMTEIDEGSQSFAVFRCNGQ
jgi:hypothetical protein